MRTDYAMIVITGLYLSLSAPSGGGLSGFGSLGSILRATTAALGDAIAIQCAPDDVVAHTWQVFYATATDQHYGVFL